MVHCRSAFELGTSGLPYYCTSICVRSWCNWRATSSCVDSTTKTTTNVHVQGPLRECLRKFEAGASGLPYYYSLYHLNWYFRNLFQNSKVKARTSLLPRFSNVSFATTFELWALSFERAIRKCYPKWDWLYCTSICVCSVIGTLAVWIQNQK